MFARRKTFCGSLWKPVHATARKKAPGTFCRGHRRVLPSLEKSTRSFQDNGNGCVRSRMESNIVLKTDWLVARRDIVEKRHGYWNPDPVAAALIRVVRKALGLTLAKAAAAVGRSPHTLCNAESGRAGQRL